MEFARLISVLSGTGINLHYSIALLSSPSALHSQDKIYFTI